jgi:hypothetical protein
MQNGRHIDTSFASETRVFPTRFPCGTRCSNFTLYSAWGVVTSGVGPGKFKQHAFEGGEPSLVQMFDHIHDGRHIGTTQPFVTVCQRSMQQLGGGQGGPGSGARLHSPAPRSDTSIPTSTSRGIARSLSNAESRLASSTTHVDHKRASEALHGMGDRLNALVVQADQRLEGSLLARTDLLPTDTGLSPLTASSSGTSLSSAILDRLFWCLR